MFKTDETVRFGQILSARTLRYGKFNEYIIIIIVNIEVTPSPRQPEGSSFLQPQRPLRVRAPSTREDILLRRAGNPLQPFWAPRLVRLQYAESYFSSLLSDFYIHLTSHLNTHTIQSRIIR